MSGGVLAVALTYPFQSAILISCCCGSVMVCNLPSGVQETLLGAALRLLGLLLLLDLGGLRLDLTGTCEGSVNLTHVGLCVIEGLL